jgi:Flp pilus assembly pilin Flp
VLCLRGNLKMLKKFTSKFLRNQDGATAVEYVLIIAGIAVVLIGAIGLFGDALVAQIEALTAALFS